MTETLNPTAPATEKKFRLFSEELGAALATLKAERNLTNRQLGVMLGCDQSYVSKAINRSNDFDPAPLEAAVQDMLKSEKLRSRDALELFDTVFTDRIRGAYETIRKTADVGLIFSPAGLGKSSAMALEQRDRPLTFTITAAKGAASASCIETELFGLIETKEWNGNTKRRKFIVERTKHSGRLLVVDNGQRLHSDALQYLFDLHDETGMPIALQGNPEIEKVIRRNDQMFSRIGLKLDVRVMNDAGKRVAKEGEVGAVVDGILRRMVPDWAGKVRDLALQVAWQQGHFRALRKTITLAHEFMAASDALRDPRKAFAAAHQKLVRNYALEGAE
jgi:DNA transposition AAA+ family ATPase